MLAITPGTVELEPVQNVALWLVIQMMVCLFLSYIWQVNGSQVAVGSTWTVNSVDASVGDSLTCTAIAVDFEGNSTTSTSVALTISNTAPVVSGVVLNNLSPHTNEVLSVSPATLTSMRQCHSEL